MRRTFPFLIAILLLLSRAVALDAAPPQGPRVPPASIELWIEGVPAGASHSAPAPREACTLFVADLRMTQAVDAQGGKTVLLLGPGVNNGDFASGSPDCNSYLVESVSVVTATATAPTASGKVAAMVADPKVQMHIPRMVRYLGMPDLKQGRYFVFSAKVRAKKELGRMTHAALSVIFKDAKQIPLLEYHGDQVAVNADGWVEAKLEFDYDRGIPKKIPTATPDAKARLAELVAAQRAGWPDYDTSPRADDGRNLALSVAKWEGRAGIPGEPFRVWAVGASWTAALASTSYRLQYAIQQRFPKAPPVEVMCQAGSGCPWNYARGWIGQFVLAQRPDLILIYTHGDPEQLDLMLADIRRHSTADILVPSLHLMGHEDADPDRWVETFQAGYGFPIRALRDVCKKHGVEFVENRRELAEYLKRIDRKPSALLADPAHENEHGLCRTWDNIVRHVARPERFAYDCQSRERHLGVSPPAKSARESVVLSDGWSAAGGVVARAGRANRSRSNSRATASTCSAAPSKAAGRFACSSTAGRRTSRRFSSAPTFSRIPNRSPGRLSAPARETWGLTRLGLPRTWLPNLGR